MDDIKKTRQQLLDELEKTRARLLEYEKEEDSDGPELLKNHNLVQTVLGTIRDGVTLVDGQYIIQYQNEYLRNIFGDRVGEKCYNVYVFRDQPCDDCPCPGIEVAGDQVRDRRKVVMLSGETTYWEKLITLVGESEKQQEKQYLIIARNVTRQCKTEQQVENQQFLCQRILDNNLSAILVFDRDGFISYANIAASRLLGIPTTALFGLRYNNSQIMLYDENGCPIPDAQQPFQRAVREKRTIHASFRFRKPSDDSVRMLHIIANPLRNENDGFTGLFAVIEDISEEEKYSIEYLESKGLIDSLFVTMNDGLITVDRGHNIVMANQSAAGLLGYSIDELYNVQFIDLLPEGAKEKFSNWLSVNHNGGTAHPHGGVNRMIMVRKDKREIEVEFSVDLTSYCEQQFFTGILRASMGRDDLVRTLSMYRGIMDNANDLIVVKSLDGRYLLANSRIAEFVGAPIEDILGKRNSDLPLVKELAESLDAEDRKVIDTGKGIHVTRALQRNDGENRWYDYTKVPYRDVNGAILGLICIARDMTERIKAEEDLREINRKIMTLLNSTSDNIYFKDINRRFVLVNRATEKFTGFQSDKILGKTDWDVLPPDLAAMGDKSDDEVLSTGKPVLVREQATKEDGTITWLDTRKYPLFDENGKVSGIVGWSCDVTEMQENRLTIDRQLEFQKVLLSLSSLFVGMYDIKQSIDAALAKIGKFFCCDIVNLMQFDERDDTIKSVGMWLASEDLSSMVAEKVIHPTDINWLMSALMQGEPVVIENRDNLPEAAMQERQCMQDYGIKSMLNCPVVSEYGKLIGFICAEEGKRARKWNEDEIGLLQITGGIIAEALTRKKYEDELELTHHSIDHSSVNILWADLQGKILYANKSACRELGYKLEELWQLQVEDIDPHFPAEEREKFMDELKTRGSITFESSNRTKDGRLIPVEEVINFIRIKDREYVVGFITNISRRKEAERTIKASEEKYRQLFHSGNDAVFLQLWPKGRGEKVEIEINDAACRLLGYTQQELRTLNHSNFMEIPGVNKSEYTSHLHTMAKAGKDLAFELYLIRKNGERIPVEVTTNKFELQGMPAQLIIARDITYRKKMEAERERYTRLESIGTLAGGIAHDFNNILTGIMGNISLTRRFLIPGDKPDRWLENAEKASLRAKDLTGQLLTFSRGGSPVRKTVTIQKLVRETVEFAVHGSSVVCRFDLPDDLWSVTIDTGQISQAFSNIALNAKEAMPQGGAITVIGRNVDIHTRNSAMLPKGKYVKISISDEGLGIPPEYHSRIFDPYFTTKKKGTGLGLATTHSILQRHGGKISVYSEPDIGTTFNLYLPAVNVPEQCETDNEKEERQIFSGSGRILVMDDDDAIREIMVSMLEDAGYEVIAVKRGEDAVKAYRRAKEENAGIDAVILDLTITGGMGGEKTVRELQKIDRDVKAIAISGYANNTIMAEYERYGFRGVVVKPFRVEDLSGVLKQVLTSS